MGAARLNFNSLAVYDSRESFLHRRRRTDKILEEIAEYEQRSNQATRSDRTAHP